MTDDPRPATERQPLPSEDTGDLAEPPASGMTDDPLVASEEGVPYDPPSDRVLTQARVAEGGADESGTAPSDAGELERVDAVQPAVAADDRGDLPADDELLADVIEALRDSDLPAGERLRVAVVGREVRLAGEVESIDVLEELLALVGSVPGVEQVTDETRLAGAR